MSTDECTIHALRVDPPRPPLPDPAMSNGVERHSRVRLTSRWVEVQGRPALPVTGELHYSRVPRRRWEEELRVLLASGVTVVATYVFWVHHEPVRGRVDFSGGLDLAAFVETAERVGIDVVLRIGPFAHGEARGGGLPDWVLAAAPTTRCDDPAYLDLVGAWFAEIGRRVGHLTGPQSRVVGIQLENELYDQPGHLLTLKRTARACGLSAPLWTATAWGGAELPPQEVLPLYGGYADGFWDDQGAGWHDSFRDHFRFTHVWDDPGVGSDQRDPDQVVVLRPVDPHFPLATCELGGGMATAYHRRPLVRGEDVAAVANTKLGNGSAWQGFYMYAGGVNPADQLQESHATGYPNDLPRFDYDFQAPLGATGRSGPGAALLREHNAFCASFGGQLVTMSSTLPDDAPVDVHDTGTLRWAVRSDGDQGFLFVNTHQPHEPLAGASGVQFRVVVGEREIAVPDQPIDVPPGVVARWPLGLQVAGVRLEWATASAVAVVPGPRGDAPTLVLRAHDGVEARLRVAGGPVHHLQPGTPLLLEGSLRVLLVDAALASRLWWVDGGLVESSDLLWSQDGRLAVRTETAPLVARWTGEVFEPVVLAPDAEGSLTDLAVEQLVEPGAPPARYGTHRGRSSAPTDQQVDAVAGVWRLPASAPAQEGQRVELVIEWEGDVAQLRAGGVVVRDRFWDGLPWRVDLTDVDPTAELTLHVVPITPATVVDLDAAVRARVEGAPSTARVVSVVRAASVVWRELPAPLTAPWTA